MMRHALLLVALTATFLSPTTAGADAGEASTPAKAATGAAPHIKATPVAAARTYQRRRWGLFSGSSQNWNRSRGTPDDNSTIPTPVNRNPKGRPMNSPVIFPKNM
jgi:hypothetical protein